jgi:2-polyprenyl-6-methoxyphenol hydroxylase-like FAD-dependent oxidoreductase
VEFDLVIAGMGPVGAVAANLAGQFGLRTLVLDKSLTVFEKPRAMGLDHEVMRIFGNLGIAEKIAPFVMPYRPSEYRNASGQLLRHINTASAPYALGWAPNYVFLQPQVEAALRENLNRFPCVTVELGAEVVSVVSNDSGASTTVRFASGEERVIDSSHVLACDGGTSPIRNQLGLGMEDLDFDEPWLVVDVILKEGGGQSLPTTNVQYCEVERPTTFVVGPGQVRRWEFMINQGEVPAEVAQPEFVRSLIRRWLSDDEYEIWRASTYRFHALVLRDWRAGDIFFLGDAAHMTPPFLAQGMCQGIRDAANLMWKLALVKQGHASSSLLDTYQLERAPHVRATTLVTKGLGKDICERDAERARVRDERLLGEMALTPSGTIRQSLIPGLADGLLSSLSDGPRGVLFPQPLVRAANGKQGLLDEFTGMTFRVVICGVVDAGELESIKTTCSSLGAIPIQIVLVSQPGETVSGSAEQYEDLNGTLANWMRERGCTAVVVRPDHYVFGSARNVDEALRMTLELGDSMYKIFQRDSPAVQAPVHDQLRMYDHYRSNMDIPQHGS